MSETGQPGAATPGEHGDGTGRHDDPTRSGSGWAPPGAGWSGGADAPAYRETTSPWHRPEPSGWGASSPRHGDLPAPVPDPRSDVDPAPRNGRPHLNGTSHPGEEPPAGRPAPVSAPPAEAWSGADARRDGDGDRLIVPAQRPAPAAEQQHDPDAGPARHASDDPPRAGCWSDDGFPASAPPVQVPPVGTAPSGFEVPPGFHAPRADRAEAGPSAADSPTWSDRGEPGPSATEPPTWADRREPGQSAGEPSAWADRREPGPSAPEQPAWAGRAEPGQSATEPPAWAGRGEPGPSTVEPWADRFPPEPTEPERPAGSPVAGRPADEPDWSGPSWNRPSWGGSWAPPWTREEEPSAGLRGAREEEPSSGLRGAREEEPSSGRRARVERTEWSAEPARPYEPVRTEPARPYEPVRAEPARPYEPLRSELPRPYEVTRSEPEPSVRPVDRPAWAAHSAPAAAPPAAAPRSAPPAMAPRSAPPAMAPRSAPPAAAPRSAPPAMAPRSAPPAPAGVPSALAPGSAPPALAPRSAPPASSPASAPPAVAEEQTNAATITERAAPPFRLRSVPGEPTAPADLPGHPPAPAGPGTATAPVTSGTRRPDPTPSAPAPTSAPPYAARRSAPDPAPAAPPAVGDEIPDAGAAVLPQRVPAEPDVPVVPEPPAVEPPAETPELARIATHLRRDDEPAPPQERPEGFDVNAILDAVREVAGVRDAALRRTPAGAHSLRLDLADGADPAEVSRMVARLLQERMGLAAAPQNLPAAAPAPLRRRSAPGRSAEPRAAEARTRATPGPESSVPRPGDARAGEPGAAPAGRSRVAEPAVDPVDERPGAPGQEDEPGTVGGVPRRRRQAAPHRGRASVEEAALSAAPTATGSPATLGTSYSGGQMTTTETAPSRPLDTGGVPGPRVVIDHVQVSTFGLDATVEVRLLAAGENAAGHATGPAVDGYVLRLCAVAAAAAVDQLLRGGGRTPERGRCFVEHAAVVPFGNCEVATVVVLLVCDGWVEQLAGSALVAGDPRQAVVRATLAAVNRRLEALLA
ncbi:hypothetical protein AB0K04_26415 [Micromonospora coxensis]|uniref:hypothetical protein n=1 Tax=Micromonospora coxensis TaxID=356852 RepID=UPI00342D9788